MSRGNSRSHANSWIGYCRLSRTRITGFKKKRLGHPSEKLSADVPRASWRVIILGEIIGPICVAVILTTAYLFVKSFQVPAANGLLRIAVIAFGPILWNATLLLVLFFVSLFAGPLLAGCCARFGSIIAAVAHVGSVVGLVAFFEFLVRSLTTVLVQAAADIAVHNLIRSIRSGTLRFGTPVTPSSA